MLALGWLLVGCSSERYTGVVKDTYSKTVHIEVMTTVNQYSLILTPNGNIEVDRSTVTIPIVGSGVIVSQSGHILTCAHIFTVGKASTPYVTMLNGTTLPATIIYQDEAKDLALIKIEGTYRPALLSSRPLEVGQEVIAIGSPAGLAFTVTHGIVSYLGRAIGEDYLFTQTDTPLNKGNSGGPLFNMQGELVGINARVMPNTDGLGLAISPNTIRSFMRVFRGLSYEY